MIKLCQNNCGVEIEASKNKKYCEKCSKLKRKESMSKFMKKYLPKYCEENKENIAERKAKWFQKNKERLREEGRAKSKKYYEENKKRLREKAKERAREYCKKKLNSTNLTTII